MRLRNGVRLKSMNCATGFSDEKMDCKMGKREREGERRKWAGAGWRGGAGVVKGGQSEERKRRKKGNVASLAKPGFAGSIVFCEAQRGNDLIEWMGGGGGRAETRPLVLVGTMWKKSRSGISPSSSSSPLPIRSPRNLFSSPHLTRHAFLV